LCLSLRHGNPIVSGRTSFSCPWLTAGSLCNASGLWLLGRVAWSLGKFWHTLLVFSAGNALAVPNYVAGPSFLIATLIIIAFRVGPEERMLPEEIGVEYEA
jgi:hypothetical protein